MKTQSKGTESNASTPVKRARRLRPMTLVAGAVALFVLGGLASQLVELVVSRVANAGAVTTPSPIGEPAVPPSPVGDGVSTEEERTIAEDAERDVSPDVPSPVVRPATGDDGPLVIPTDAARRRQLVRGWDTLCARSREAEPSVVLASLPGGDTAASLRDVESGLVALRELCDHTARVIQAREFADDVLRDLDYVEERIDGVRPECGPPVRMNWDAEARKIAELLGQMVRAVEAMAVGVSNEVGDLQAQTRVRLGAMFNSVDYYRQFARDICESYDLMKKDLETENRHAELLSAAAGGMFRDGIEGLSDADFGGAVDAFVKEAVSVTCQSDETNAQDIANLAARALFGRSAAPRRVIVPCIDTFYNGSPSQIRSRQLFGSATSSNSAIGSILVDPRVTALNDPARYVGPGGGVEVVKRYVTVNRGRVVLPDVSPTGASSVDVYPAGGALRQEFSGATVRGLDVFIRHGWGSQASVRGSDRPLVDFLEGVTPYVQRVVNEECVGDFTSDTGNLALQTRFGAALRRLQPSLPGSERGVLLSVFGEAIKKFQGDGVVTGVIDEICSEDSPTLGARRVAQVLENAHRSVLFGSDDPTERRSVLVTDPSAGYLSRFDRAFYVGGALMQGLQIDAILVMENPNGNAVRALEELLKEIDPDDVQFSFDDLEKTSVVAMAMDQGRVGRERRRYEDQYNEGLAQLQVQEYEVRVLQIKNKHDMNVTLENNRNVLEKAQLETMAQVEQARLKAHGMIESARHTANGTIEAARLTQQSKAGFFDSLMPALGGVVANGFGGPVVGAVGAKLATLIVPPQSKEATGQRTTEEVK